MSAKNIWGKVVLYLKDKRQIALHVACGDITDVLLENGKLIINVYDGMLANLILQGKKSIEEAIRWQGIELEVVVSVKNVEKNKIEEDIKKLSGIFDCLQVVEKKKEN